MSSIDIKYEHIALGEDQVPTIAGTTMKVVELIIEKKVFGWSPEELQNEHPYLTMGQIHSAMAYYYDHIDEMERDIQQRSKNVQELRQAAGPSPLVTRLKTKGLL